MRWSVVRLIYVREIRDQLRDRRTLFTLAALPLLLYPLLGFGLVQMTQFLRERPSTVLLAGVDQFGDDAISPLGMLDEEGRLRPEYAGDREADLLEIRTDRTLPAADPHDASVDSNGAAQIAPIGATAADDPDADDATLRDELAQAWIEEGEFDAVVWFPPGFAERLAEYRRHLSDLSADSSSSDSSFSDASGAATPEAPASSDAHGASPDSPAMTPPQPILYVDTANDRSRVAWTRTELILSRWREAWVQRNFAEINLPADAARPFELTTSDVAREQTKKAHLWAKILPFVALVWALTGAFYPAIDLCAGEKERGTLETLLASPADRSEIVGGKLLAVATFSMATALLNLASMGITGSIAMRQMAGLAAANAASLPLGPPPLATVFWLVVALPPVALLFSALSLAVAAFARSSKEGQYYLMPLLIMTLPLILVPMLPSAELDLGTSLIPIAGMMLWMRALMEGDWYDAMRFAAPAFGITLIGTILAAQWAVRQFSDESVLFRESERFSLKLWVTHLMRDRGDLPTFSQAILAGILILVVRFFASFAATMPESFADFAVGQSVSLIAFLAAPAALMAIMLTRKPLASLKLRRPHWAAIPGAVLLAFFLHPAGMLVTEFVHELYPISPEMTQGLQKLQTVIADAPNFFVLLLVLAAVPAICEELAFRGFVLTGLQSSGRKWMAILVSGIFFGAAHGILQQSISACVLGAVIGYVAYQTRSIFPAIAFHFVYNSLGMTLSFKAPEWFERFPALAFAFRPVVDEAGHVGYLYGETYTLFATLIAVGLLYCFRQYTRDASLLEEIRLRYLPSALVPAATAATSPESPE